MKVIQSVLIAGALCTAFAGTANAGSDFSKQLRQLQKFVKKGDFKEAGRRDRNRFARQTRKAIRELRRRNRR